MYEKETSPLLDYYRAKGLLKDVDSNGLTVEEVYAKIKAVLDNL